MEHRATAIAIIERNKPNMALNAETLEKYLQERQLEQAKEQLNPNISILAKTNNSYYGKSYSQVLKAQFKAQKMGLFIILK